jgi:RNA polymerase sigma factor (sigma-70 family)
MENDLLAKLQARNKKAQRQLRKDLFPKVIASCRFILKDEIWAEECAEDIWMDFLYKFVDRVKHEHALPSYLRMLTVRRCIRLRNWQRRHIEIDQAPIDQASAEEEVVSQIDQERLLAQLEECLKQLSSRVRSVIRLRYYNNLKYDNIGQALGTSPQYAGRVVSKGLESLRQCLEQNL